MYRGRYGIRCYIVNLDVLWVMFGILYFLATTSYSRLTWRSLWMAALYHVPRSVSEASKRFWLFRYYSYWWHHNKIIKDIPSRASLKHYGVIHMYMIFSILMQEELHMIETNYIRRIEDDIWTQHTSMYPNISKQKKSFAKICLLYFNIDHYFRANCQILKNAFLK